MEQPTTQERQLAGLARLSPLVGLIVPSLNLFAPLIFLVLAPDPSFVRDHAVSEAKYQAVWTVLVLAWLFLALGLVSCTFGLGLFIVAPSVLLFLPSAIWWCYATAAAFSGKPYAYPLTG